jgi:DNA polymerase-4
LANAAPSRKSSGDELVNWLFLDLNSYFASVEQQLRPELRGKPIAVVPVMVDTTCCIAASYEAKAYGIRTGTIVGEAKRMCPELILVEGRQDLYVEFHYRIVAVVQNCIPVTAVASIDEMACRLMGRERQMQNALQLGTEIKQKIRSQVGQELRCSVGLAPNRFLAKVASDMQKPDGLVALCASQLPQALFKLKPSDLPGIGHRTNQRLERKGIFTMQQLCALSRTQMYDLWGSVWGERLWHLLRGDDWDEDYDAPQKSVSHSHVLSPEFRTREGAELVMQKLLHKAAARLRKLQVWARGLSVFVTFSPRREKKHWERHLRLQECQDTVTLLEAFRKMWQECPATMGNPMLVGLALYDLVPDAMHTASLLQDESKLGRLSEAMDFLNAKYGSSTLHLGGLQQVRSAAPTRIAFSSIPEFEKPDPTLRRKKKQH